MKPALVKKWKTALESGEYAQGKGRLCRAVYDNKGEEQYEFCCLGVLVNLVEGFDSETNDVRHVNGKILKHDQKTLMPSARFLKTIELDESVASRLAALNDDGLDFKSIAKEIDREIPIIT